MSNNPVLGEESDSELSKSLAGLESDNTILSRGEEMDSETVPKTAVQAETDETGSKIVFRTEKPIAHAPRRSTRVKSRAQLRPDFAYNFAQTTANSETVQETKMHRDALQNVKFFRNL